MDASFETRVFIKKRNDSLLGPVLASVFGHLAIAAFVFLEIFPKWNKFEEPVVYSISLESSRAIGGISQTPKDDKKTEMAPVKNVSNEKEEVKEVKPPDPVVPDKVIPEEPDDDAEVSLSEEKPTPVPKKPTPAPTVVPTKAPTKLPTGAATAKPTTAPTAKPVKTPNKKAQEEEADKRYQAAMQRYTGESTDAGGKGFGGAKAGIGKGGGGGVVRPPEFFTYQRLMMNRIKDAWRWYDTNAALITQITFYMDPDGRVHDVEVVKSSGDRSFDESVVRAVMKSSPFPPPPATVYEYFKYVRTAFDPRE